MSSSITRSVRDFKSDLRSIVAPSRILRLCQAARHVWRDRRLGPVSESDSVAQVGSSHRSSSIPYAPDHRRRESSDAVTRVTRT